MDTLSWVCKAYLIASRASGVHMAGFSDLLINLFKVMRLNQIQDSIRGRQSGSGRSSSDREYVSDDQSISLLP